MSRLVAVAMLSSFPYRSITATSGPAGIEPLSVGLALEFIEQNAHLPIGPVDIAKAAGISIRALQHALRRHRDTTPSALLRSIRLDRVHFALQAGEPGQESVSATARQWGFVHLGRFSGHYQERFGQHPSHTLRNVR